MVSNVLKSKIEALFIILGVLMIFFLLPNILTGHSIDQNNLPDVKGEWSMTSIMSFNQVECQASSSDKTDSVSSSIFIDQTGETLSARISDFSSEDGHMKFFGGPITVGFLSEKSLYGTMTLKSSRQGTLTHQFTNMILSENCNNIIGSYTWKYEEGRRVCDGSGTFTMDRKNPTGCGLKCLENWSCSDWECINGTETRVCDDISINCKETTRPSESRTCDLPAPVIQPEKESNWIYLIIFLIILIVAAGVVLLKMQLKKRKENMLSQLRDGIEKINQATSRGDKVEAMNQYRIFGERFAKYKSFIKEEDYNKLYEDVLKAYNRILQSNSGF